jgi:ADP-ribosylarginine hydrolase
MTFTMNERYEACIVLHALGDTIGFRDGIWEFNYGRQFYFEDLMEIFYDFIGLGGINHLDTKGWKVSDDTLLHMATARAYIYEKNMNFDNLAKLMIEKYTPVIKYENRYPGITTVNSLKQIQKGIDWKKLPYDDNSGGAGGSMRTSCLGLIFYGKEKRKDLIKHAIETTRITHNNVIGYLGGLVSALFTAFAVEGVIVNKWPHKLVELLESNIIDEYITSTRGIDMYEKEKHIFIGRWKQYIEDKYKEDTFDFKKPMYNLVQRAKYYHNTFRNQEKGSFIGSGGDDSVIIAYDCLVDAGKNWEKLVVYAMLHIGDTDTTGCIAASWYGILYGYTDIPKHMIDNLEFGDKIKKTGQVLYQLYHK